MGQALVVGLIAGGIYGLYALGLVLVFKGSGVLNFAQAELGTFALFVAQCVIVGHGQPYLVGAAVALLTARRHRSRVRARSRCGRCATRRA